MILLLCLLLSFCCDWEDISNTRDSVSLAIQTPQILLKILSCVSSFQLSSQCLDILVIINTVCCVWYINCKVSVNVREFYVQGKLVELPFTLNIMQCFLSVSPSRPLVFWHWTSTLTTFPKSSATGSPFH